MIPLIEEHREQIEALCRKHGVKTLELFGSATHGDFDPTHSDIDFFVELADYSSMSIVDQWFGLQEDLEAELGFKVDFTSPSAAENPYFLEEANRHRELLYAAPSEKIPVGYEEVGGVDRGVFGKVVQKRICRTMSCFDQPFTSSSRSSVKP